MVKKGYGSVKRGENVVQKGLVHKFSRFRGAYPQVVVKREDDFAPSCVAAVSSNAVPEKKKKTVCVLGMGRGCLSSASNYFFREVWGKRGHVPWVCFLYTPKRLKNPGVYPK